MCSRGDLDVGTHAIWPELLLDPLWAPTHTHAWLHTLIVLDVGLRLWQKPSGASPFSPFCSLKAAH